MIDVCNLAHLCKMWRRKTVCVRCDTKELSARAHFKFVTENVTKIFHMRKKIKEKLKKKHRQTNETKRNEEMIAKIHSTAQYSKLWHTFRAHTAKNLCILWMRVSGSGPRPPNGPPAHISSYIKYCCCRCRWRRRQCNINNNQRANCTRGRQTLAVVRLESPFV